MKNKLLSQLWCLPFSCHEVFHCSHATHCTHIGHLSQAEEPRHHCNPMWLGEQHLTLATCQPSGQGRWPGPSATRSWHTATTISWLPCHSREHPERFPSFPCLSFVGVATGAPLHIRHFTSTGRGSGTALCAPPEGCPRHPSTSLPGAGAPTPQSCPCTHLPKAAQLRRHPQSSSLPSRREAQPQAGGRHARACQLPFS